MTRHLTGWWLQHWSGNVRETIEQAVRINATGILVKAADGNVWQRAYDRQAPGSLADLFDMATLASFNALKLGVWVVPQHGPREYLLSQAALYASMAEHVDCIAFDVEPYEQAGVDPMFSGFWGAGHPAEDAWLLMDSFRQKAPNVVTLLQSDGRPARMAEIRAEAWLPYCNVYAPQAYWTDMQRAPFAVVQDCWAAVWHNDALRRSDLEFAPTLPGWDADPNALYNVGSRLGETYGATAAILWRAPLGNDGRQAEREAMIKRVELWTPPPPDPCAALERDLLALKAGLRTELARPRLSRKRLEALAR